MVRRGTLAGLSAVWLVVLALLVPAFAQETVIDSGPSAAGPGNEAVTIPETSLSQPVRRDWSDPDVWRQVRGGVVGDVSIPDKKAGQLVQTAGETWRDVRNGPLLFWSGVALIGMLALLLLVFLVKGRIRIESGRSGMYLPRFNWFERANHWTMAVSFIVLAITGLALLFGRKLLIPVVGLHAYSGIAGWGKTFHNFVSFAFMISLALAFALWVAKNLPNRYDWQWLKMGGGMFGKGHPPAKKFNAGQKLLFWVMMLGGLSVSLSGWALLYPFETSLFSGTIDLFDRAAGTDYAAGIGPLQEQQLASIWHAVVGVALTAIVFAHIYIGTIGMEGAFEAMGRGEVDLNWAREHHNMWVVDKERELDEDLGRRPLPAE